MRSGAYECRLSDEEGKLLWTGIVFALFLLPDRQLSLSAVEVVGFLSDVAPVDLLNVSVVRKETVTAAADPSRGGDDSFASSFSSSLAAITMQQCVFPMTIETRHVISPLICTDRSSDNSHLDSSNSEHWTEEIKCVQSFRQARRGFVCFVFIEYLIDLFV